MIESFQDSTSLNDCFMHPAPTNPCLSLSNEINTTPNSSITAVYTLMHT